MTDAPFAPTPMFSTPMFASVIGEHEAHKDGLLSLIAASRAADPGVGRSNRGGGWHSGPEFLTLRSPHIGWVLQRVHAFAERALAPLYGDWADRELRLGSYWANVLPPGAWNAPHHHHPQHWSGVYYVSVPHVGDGGADPAGFIEFLNPSVVQSQWGAGSFARAPREGSTLLFPASVMHLVHPHRGEDDRVSIAYNFDVVPRRPR